MAQTARKKSADRSPGAIALLKSDHREVEELLASFEETEDEDELGAMAQRICQLLTIHAQIEEELVYPAAREALQDDDEDIELVSEAEIEHETAKELIAKIEALTPDDEYFRATVKVLGEYVQHHVQEEEKELFPKLKQTDLDLEKLGERLAARKRELMEQLGADEEDEENRDE